jgi:succinoglycan biosynthesis protein ExoA
MALTQIENDGPAISVVIPCRNEAAHIKACVTSVLLQEAPPGGFEVIVADGESNDGTREILEATVRGIDSSRARRRQHQAPLADRQLNELARKPRGND